MEWGGWGLGLKGKDGRDIPSIFLIFLHGEEGWLVKVNDSAVAGTVSENTTTARRVFMKSLTAKAR